MPYRFRSHCWHPQFERHFGNASSARKQGYHHRMPDARHILWGGHGGFTARMKTEKNEILHPQFHSEPSCDSTHYFPKAYYNNMRFPWASTWMPKHQTTNTSPKLPAMFAWPLQSLNSTLTFYHRPPSPNRARAGALHLEGTWRLRQGRP